MRYQTIQSDANAKFKRWKKLADNTRFIKKEGATLAEGAHLVLTLSERKIKPAALIFRASGVSDEVSEVIRRWSDEGVECYVLDNKLYDQISPVEHGAGVIAEVKIKEESLPQHDRCDVLYLDGVQDPGNVGTLIRTAVAAGVTVIAASRDFDATRLAADARGGSDLYETPDWEAHHTVWMMGAEGPGLSEAALSVADKRLYIPIIKDCESLNVGAAAAVCLFEQRRRRLLVKKLK